MLLVGVGIVLYMGSFACGVLLPRFNIVIEIVGASLGTMLAYILPPVFYQVCDLFRRNPLPQCAVHMHIQHAAWSPEGYVEK